MKLKRKTIILLSILVVAIIGTVILYLRYRTQQVNVAVTPSPTPFQRVVDPIVTGEREPLNIGVTNLEEISDSLGEELLFENGIHFYSSKSPVEYNEAMFSDSGQLIFFKEFITYEQERDIAELVSKYSLQNPTIMYGEEYEHNIVLYAYPNSGIALLASTDFSYLVEVWYFVPTDIQSFITNYSLGYYRTPTELEDNTEIFF